MPAAHQDAGGGQHKHQHFEDGDDAQQPLLATRQGKRQLGEADDSQARQDDDAHKVADVALADEGQPAPALRDAADDTVCAVMLELVQGEGGVVALDADYVAKVAEFCKKRDLVLIVDEVQTGVGRTGKFLACEHFDLHPDIVTLAKGLGGGLPIGAVLMTAKVAEHMGPGTHGSTFGGNPVVCAGALAVLDAMDEAFMDNVLTQAARLRTGLKTLPHVTEVSGLGLMVGIAFEDGIKAADVRAACEKEGLLVLTAKTRLRLLPPLILTETDVDTALDTLRTVLEKF